MDNNELMFDVVVNHEEQYSIWPAGRAYPSGWRYAGLTADKQACLEHIEKVWVDMRPLSVRNQLAGAGGR